MKKIEEYPAIKAILDKCYEDIQRVTGKKVSVNFSLKFREVDTPQLRFIVAKCCGVTWEQITSDKSGGMVIIARQLYCFFARIIQNKTLEGIGNEINRKHETVSYSLERMQAMIDTNDELYMPYVKAIEEAINKTIIG